ncbi:Unknown protein, partial [Striga hermonthica]
SSRLSEWTLMMTGRPSSLVYEDGIVEGYLYFLRTLNNIFVHINNIFYWLILFKMDNVYAIVLFDCVKDEFSGAAIRILPTYKKVNSYSILLAEFHRSLAAAVYDFHFAAMR